jgi:hypothetical protein
MLCPIPALGAQIAIENYVHSFRVNVLTMMATH